MACFAVPVLRVPLSEKGRLVTIAADTRTSVQVRPVAGYTGADISGADLSKPLSAGEIAQLQKVLFVNPGFTSHIVDLSLRESKAILDLLYSELTRPEYTVRFRWEPGSLAFWDNRATAHLAPRDYEHLGKQRTLHRVTLIGDVPVGPDGRESELVAGKPFTDKHQVVVAAAN